MWLRTFGGLFLALVISAVLAGLFFPAVNPCNPQSRSAWARTDAAAIVAAVKAYNTEYGKYPGLDHKGPFSDAESNAFLLRILRGIDTTRNPRRILFFSGKTATKSPEVGTRYRGGFHPETGVFLDPWGNPYRIAIDSDYDNQITSPYPDDSPPIQVGVIVWSLGKDGKQGSPANPHTCKGSDDVTSWQ